MILALKTDSPTAEIYLIDGSGEAATQDTWLAGRNLARDLLARIEQLLVDHGGWQGVSGVVIFRGPGSFTGLRIGITTANTIAYSCDIPIVGTEGEEWLAEGVRRLQAGENDRMVLPHYGADPHITPPKK